MTNFNTTFHITLPITINSYYSKERGGGGGGGGESLRPSLPLGLRSVGVLRRIILARTRG